MYITFLEVVSFPQCDDLMIQKCTLLPQYDKCLSLVSNSAIFARINLSCQKRKQVFHKCQTTTVMLSKWKLVCLAASHLSTPPCQFPCITLLFLSVLLGRYPFLVQSNTNSCQAGILCCPPPIPYSKLIT